MSHFSLRLDMRAPTFAQSPPSRQYAAGLPSPLVYAAAIAGRTSQIRIRISALILPLHDVLRVAEDVAVVDNISNGRIELVVAGGFLPSEFAMFERSLSERGRRVEEGVALLKQAWTGEPFEYEGRELRVTPRPVQRPHPPILLGGSSESAARRAARIADGFVPAVPDLYAAYVEACRDLDRSPEVPRALGPGFLHVADDPEAAWAK
ncbi:MAG: LLM class flavin-dependent oxidoreductase, partial [Deltaproteobacteria bacterium]|nr:LLM class flavin-dependent oxidoreductase [Deltaproteobacteria bacterium]